jgi:DNA-directed RNA polymerase subunit RPC12/RpoP
MNLCYVPELEQALRYPAVLILVLSIAGYFLKCGLCGKEVKEQPKITADGKCSICGAKLRAHQLD